MDTSNKIRVTGRDVRDIKRTGSSGVRDPSDLKHFPTLGGTEGAMVKAATPERRLPSLLSFKESLLSSPSLDEVRVDFDGSMASMAGTETKGPRLAMPDNALAPASSSPRILAERLAPSIVGAGTAEPDLITGPKQQVSQIFDTIPGIPAKLH